jgi:hypothetical protein
MHFCRKGAETVSGRQSRTIQGNKGRRDAGIIIILMILLFAVTFANVFFTFEQNA